MDHRYAIIAIALAMACAVASQIIDPHKFVSGGSTGFSESFEHWQYIGHSTTEVDVTEYFDLLNTI